LRSAFGAVESCDAQGEIALVADEDLGTKRENMEFVLLLFNKYWTERWLSSEACWSTPQPTL